MKLKAKKLSVGYSKTALLTDIDFEVAAGNFVTIIGKNGSGKSTLLKTLSNILPKIAGDISINNHNLSKFSDTERASYISIVLTEKITLPLTVEEVIKLGRQAFSNRFDQLSEHDKKIIHRVITDLSLQKLVHKSVHELSDGEYQKVMIGRALVQETPILMLDEPTTHLDPENKAIILRLLKEISIKQQKIIILSTHDIELVLPITDKVWIIEKNELKEIGNSTELPIHLQSLFNENIIYYDKDCKKFKLV